MDKQKHPIDDLFREALKDLREEPSAAGREASLNEAERELRRSGQRKWWLIIPLLFLILAGITTGTWVILSSPGSENIATVAPAPPTTTVTEPEPASMPDKDINSKPQSEEKTTLKEKQTINVSGHTAQQTPPAPVSKAITISEEKKQTTVNTGAEPPALPEVPTRPLTDSLEPAPAASQVVPVPDTIPVKDTILPAKTGKPSLQRKTSSIKPFFVLIHSVLLPAISKPALRNSFKLAVFPAVMLQNN